MYDKSINLVAWRIFMTSIYRTKKSSTVGLVLLSLSMVSGLAYSASATDVDQMTTYATILGRAIGCGVETGEAQRKVGRWMDQQFPPGSDDQKTYLPVFIEGMRKSAEDQSKGRSPDSCSTIRRGFADFPWPSVSARSENKVSATAKSHGLSSDSPRSKVSGEATADCQNLPTNAALSECFSDWLKKETAAINDVYRRYQTQLTPSEQEQLKRIQRSWINFRDQDCEFYASPVKSGSMYGSVHAQCQIEHTRLRRKALENYLGCKTGTTPGMHCGS